MHATCARAWPPLAVFWGGPAPVAAECTPPIEPVDTTMPAAVLVSMHPIG